MATEAGGEIVASLATQNTLAIESSTLEAHVGETGTKDYLFFDVNVAGVKTAKSFASYTHLKWCFSLNGTTVTLNTADIGISGNILTISLASLTGAAGEYDWTLWDWGTNHSVIMCGTLLVSEAVA